MAALAGEAGRTVAGEVVDQIGAIGAEQAGSFGAIVGVDLAALALPSRQALALVATLLKRHAGPAVVAGILAGGAGIYLQRQRQSIKFLYVYVYKREIRREYFGLDARRLLFRSERGK